ncbi:hypothetical protein AN2170.2 [Aspergillus nidulans FGSC A4]|uniref:Uncharacterized protein n=1 Tax=Emericella nidulans (strain FGSC A4 / ATCC 38163 / CBS 112.46 / NRRL 194 / M139) TaxID=227321 RepID=Q5BBB0_EMENI|nr:hypothetical protein [Aspergillus nidulans FGSC A4]EAA64214.1 hypothetical protein AN2170.2 [Aspergillus nidulans FGSC A4]CBF86310.1 TPA: hypothetical protein ANIA_02170 [Aspergillus nidulans FGSC A4]|eukprot:XP_659774.1 hypothetical protein AN2170.2 [Aspergillus nidulans FGSC A4]
MRRKYVNLQLFEGLFKGVLGVKGPEDDRSGS